MSPRHGFTLASVVSLGLALVACEVLPGRPDPARRPVAPSQIMAFDVLYKQHCAGCHGSDGRLGAARPLNDPVYLALIPPDRLHKVIAEGVPGTSMPGSGLSAGGGLTDAQIDALVKGMLASWGRPDSVRGVALPPYDAGTVHPDDKSAAGAAVYANACARCHGPEGKGGPKAGSIVDPSFLALVSDQSLRTTVIAGRPDLAKPDWREDIPGRPLTPQQISDVVDWLAGQRRPVSGRPSSDAVPSRARP